MPATMPQIADVMIFPWPAGRTAFERLRRESGHPIERAADYESIRGYNARQARIMRSIGRRVCTVLDGPAGGPLARQRLPVLRRTLSEH